jgi:hypothetical protein
MKAVKLSDCRPPQWQDVLSPEQLAALDRRRRLDRAADRIAASQQAVFAAIGRRLDRLERRKP